MMKHGECEYVIHGFLRNGLFPSRFEEIRGLEGCGEGVDFGSGDFEQPCAEIEARISAVKTAVGKVLRRVAVPAAEIGDRGIRRDAPQQALRAGLDFSARGRKGGGEGLIEFPIEGYEAAGDV